MYDRNLAPCPFCGEQFTYTCWLGRPAPNEDRFAVRCPNCGMHGPITSTEEKARERYSVIEKEHSNASIED